MSEGNNGKIGLVAATVIGINAMIGAGIFAMPATLAHIVGPASILSFMISSLVILSIVFPLGRLAQLHPGEGWGYRYPALWGGHFMGMLSSVGYITGVIVAMGFLTQQAGVWLSQFLPYSPTIIGVAILAIIVALVLGGTQISTWGQYLIAFCVLVPLGITALVCWGNADLNLLTPFAPYGYKAVFSALPVVIFSLLGFESIASLYRVVRNPQRNVPLAAVISVLTVVGMYTLFVSGAMAAIPVKFFSGTDQPLAGPLLAVLPHLGFMKIILTVGAFFGIFGTLHSMVWSVAELLFDVTRKARNGVVTGLIRNGMLCEKGCIWIVGLATLVCTIFLKAKVIFSLTPLFIIPSYTLSIIALLTDRGEWHSGQNIWALAALVSSGGMIYLSVCNVLPLIFG